LNEAATGGLTKSASAARGAMSEVEKAAKAAADEMAKNAEEVGNWDSRARAAFTTQLLLAQGVTSVADAMSAVNPVVLSTIRGMQEQEQLARDLTDALLGVSAGGDAAADAL